MSSPFTHRPSKVSMNKGTQGGHARYDMVLPLSISVVWSPGRPVMWVPDLVGKDGVQCEPHFVN